MKALRIAAAAALVCLMLTHSAQASDTLSSNTCPGSGCVVYDVTGLGSIGVEITIVSGTATIQFEQSIAGSAYVSIPMTPYNSTTTVTSTTATGFWTGTAAGAKKIRIRASACSSCSVTVDVSTAIARTGSGGGGGSGAGSSSDTQILYNSSNVITGSADITRPSSGVLKLDAANVKSQFILNDQTFDSIRILSSGPGGGESQAVIKFADAEGAGTSYDSGISRCGIGCIEINSGVIATLRDFKLRHILGGGPAPTVAGTSANACGTTAPAITAGSSDLAGSFTVGATSGTSCTVTFGTAWTNPPSCFAYDESTVATRPSVIVTTTTIVIAGAFTAGDVVRYGCPASY